MTTGVPNLHKDWVCAKGCGSSARTYDAKIPHHRCKRMGGLMVPLIVEGTRADVRLVERGDYVRDEMVTTDADGHPWMSVVTERNDGMDCTVFAPCAVAKAERE